MSTISSARAIPSVSTSIPHHLPTWFQEVREGDGEGRRRLHRGEGDLADVVAQGEAEGVLRRPGRSRLATLARGCPGRG